jgi:hypothetical protein
VTDSRLKFNGDNARHLGPDRVFRIAGDGKATVALEGDLESPQGDGRERPIIDRLTTPAAIGFDVKRRRLLIPSFEANTVQLWNLAK